MGFSSHSQNSLCTIFLLVLPALLCSTSAEAANLVNEICPQTRNATRCYRVLRSKPNGNLHDLGELAIGAAQEPGFLAYDTINVLIKQGAPPFLIQRYRSCLGNYARANGDITASRLLLRSGDYRGLSAKVSATLKEAADCDKNFNQPPSEPAQLKQGTAYFQDVVSVLSVISNRLAGR